MNDTLLGSTNTLEPFKINGVHTDLITNGCVISAPHIESSQHGKNDTILNGNVENMANFQQALINNTDHAESEQTQTGNSKPLSLSNDNDDKQVLTNNSSANFPSDKSNADTNSVTCEDSSKEDIIPELTVIETNSSPTADNDADIKASIDNSVENDLTSDQGAGSSVDSNETKLTAMENKDTLEQSTVGAESSAAEKEILSSTSVSPKSPTKKKSFWSKIAKIFKPWKWRRKKKSKKMEQQVNELERRLSVRKSREELIKRGVLKEAKSAENPSMNGDAVTQHPVIVTLPSPELNCSVDVESSKIPDAKNTSHDDENQVEHSISVSPCKNETLNNVENSDGGHVSFSQEPPTEINEEMSVSTELHSQNVMTTDFINGSLQHDDDDSSYPPPPGYNEPPPYAPPPPPIDFDDDSSSDEGEHIVNSIPLVKEVPIREPDLNAVPKKSALKKPVQTRPVVIVRTPQKPRIAAAGDTGSYHSSEDSSDEEIHYRDDPNDPVCQDSLAAKVARNDSLARFLENRPGQKELEERNILHSESEDNIESSRKEMAVKLGRKLSMRPTAEELEQRNILHDQNDDQRRADIEDIKVKLNRKLSFRPTIEELKQRNILQFSEYVEVTEAEDYDRRADKPWTRLTPRDKAAIRKELNEFKEKEMPVHDESRHLTRFHRP